MQYEPSDIKVTCNKDRTVWRFRAKGSICRHCGNPVAARTVKVYFNEACHMSMYEAEIILNRCFGIPMSDSLITMHCPLAEYEQCSAGSRFVSSIQKVIEL